MACAGWLSARSASEAKDGFAEWKDTTVIEGRTSKDSRHMTIMVSVRVWRYGKWYIYPRTRH